MVKRIRFLDTEPLTLLGRMSPSSSSALALESSSDCVEIKPYAPNPIIYRGQWLQFFEAGAGLV